MPASGACCRAVALPPPRNGTTDYRLPQVSANATAMAMTAQHPAPPSLLAGSTPPIYTGPIPPRCGVSCCRMQGGWIVDSA
jgi:hypothetical protein